MRDYGRKIRLTIFRVGVSGVETGDWIVSEIKGKNLTLWEVRLYEAMDSFISVYLQQRQVDKTRCISSGLICAIRGTTLEYMENSMDLLLTQLINKEELADGNR